MRNFQKKRGWSNILQSKPVLALFAVFLLFFAWNVFILFGKMKETAQNKKIVENKVLQLEQQKEKFSSDIKSLNTEQGKEKIFRENYGLAKDGEGVVIITEDKNSPPDPAPVSSGFWSFLKNLFK